jgi:hypothetical protein
MHSTRVLTSLGFIVVMGMPACGAKFVPLGNDDAGVGASGATAGGNQGAGGSNQGAAGGIIPLDAGLDVCFYNGVTYAVGAAFGSTDGCNTCQCTSNGIACTTMGCQNGGAGAAGGAAIGGCIYGGVSYANGSSFKSTDGCNSCTCSINGVACTTMACAAGGASSTGCDCSGLAAGDQMICPDGSSPSISCNRFTDGSCGWLSSGCPTSGAGGSGGIAGGAGTGATGAVGCGPVNLPNITCSNYQIVHDPNTGCASGYVCPQQDAGVCTCSGPAPAAPTQVCFDASIGGPICTALSTGTCGWAMRGCPVQQDAGAGGATALDAGPSAGASSSITVCVVNNVVHNQGDVFKSTDGCNTCQCTVYGTMCTTLGCVVSCPAIDLPLPQCATGSTAIAEYDAAGCLQGYKCGPIIN